MNKKKSICISQIIRNIIIAIFLLWLFFSSDGLMKFIIAPFIICVVLSLGKNIFLIFDKDKYVNIFNKLYAIVFLLFAFCFLIFWSYTVIKNNNYLTLLFTIPFWLMLIYFIHKCFFKKNQKSLSSKRETKFNIKIIVSGFLVFTVLVSGFICLIIGIKDTYHINKITKNYITTTGYFKDYEIYNSQEKRKHNRSVTSTTYRLIYTYKVDGKEYTIKTDYGSGTIPNTDSTREIKYNPDNPNEAILIGTNRNNGLIYFGTFFVLGGMVFVLIFLYAMGIFDKVKINILGLYIGIVFFIIGIGIIAFQMGTISSFMETIKTMRFWFLIPVMFIIVGIFQTIKCLFFERIEMNNNRKSN